ncbi:adhesion G-protein coupled receptor G2 [Megalops cyprinoides]|uniref:adhesion G-protein coupled receptor G2 n=1 Tax=Megalops cyprinoides TaxID=118141 RepID=UPI0018646DEE|nr:adhesion G-protein coupled receptor G2 [Megalops cyprinoides]
MFINITKNHSCQLSNLTSVTKCVTCSNPIEAPSVNIRVNTTVVSQNGDINAAAASEFMEKLSDLLTQLGNESSAVITAGPVKGILTRQRKDAKFKEVFFGLSSNSDINIVNSKVSAAEDFPGSVSISKEAFNKANLSFEGGPFAAVFRFPNMSKDEKNSTVFNDEVIAIDMGTPILDLTDSINITFQVNAGNTVMSCSSWNGTGDRPVWTTDGCNTTVSNGTVICQCTHLTFFAILMASPSESNISNSDLKSLSYITYIGCGLSMFFLGVALFMHFLLRRAKSSDATQILMNLFLAMFLLDLTFLSNEAVAGMGNLIACKIFAALLHYSMLSTFTWFAIEAFHLCLHLAKSFNIGIRHYFLKVCIGGWALPCVVVIIILICGKYGGRSINSDNGKSVQMCWIVDDTVHYVVNIGYYALVFLFTFTVFIIITRQLTYLRGRDVKAAQKGVGPANICSIMGLCCLLGVTWGFAFFAYGPLRIPSYYIFTILNSFQGFFLFLYYYNTSKIIGDEKASNLSSSSTATIKTTVDSQNPYVNKA